jgi:acyl-CoA synthetase (AMP-forming)/AMP-acid ligase II
MNDRTLTERNPLRDFGPRPHAPAVAWGGNLPAPRTADLAAVLLRAAASGPGRIVLVQDEEHETELAYGDLVAAASRVLGGLRAAGVERGDSVRITAMDERDRLVAFWACVLGGIVPFPIPRERSDREAPERQWIIGPETAEGRCLGTTAALEAHAPERDYTPGGWDDLAVLLPASGDRAKAVMLSHGNLISRIIAAIEVDGLRVDDGTFNWGPLDQADGLVTHLRDVYLRCVQVHAPARWILADPLRWIDQLHRRGTTATWAPGFAFELVNTNATRMAGRCWNLSGLRRVTCDGGVRPEVIRRFRRLLAPHGLGEVVVPGWGRTETSSTVVTSRPEPMIGNHRFLPAGEPYPGVGVRIVNHFDEVLREGEFGLLEVTGEPITAGYHGDPDATRRAFSADGWFRTGELAFLDRGRLTVTGRDGDVVIVGGQAHHPNEIERTVEATAPVEPGRTVACAVRGETGTGLVVFYIPDGVRDPVQTAKEIRESVARGHGVEVERSVPLRRGDFPATDLPRLRRTLLAQRFESGLFDGFETAGTGRP